MFKVIKDFKGSQDGMSVVDYLVGEEVDLTPDLAKVALEEKWVKTIAEKKAPAPQTPPADPLIAEIEALSLAIASEPDPAKADELKAQLEAKQAELAAK